MTVSRAVLKYSLVCDAYISFKNKCLYRNVVCLVLKGLCFANYLKLCSCNVIGPLRILSLLKSCNCAVGSIIFI